MKISKTQNQLSIRNTMSLLVSTASPSRFLELVCLFNDAFREDPSTILRGEDAQSQQAIDEAVSEFEMMQQRQECHHIIVTDTRIAKIVSFARWRMYPDGYEPEDLSAMRGDIEPIDVVKRYEMEFMTKLHKERQQLWKDKPVCCEFHRAADKSL